MMYQIKRQQIWPSCVIFFGAINYFHTDVLRKLEVPFSCAIVVDNVIGHDFNAETVNSICEACFPGHGSPVCLPA